MAQPDLVSQKIMGTDPQVGFGEASVLPYRQHQLDTRGFEAIERAQTREQARQEARKKNNEDYYNATIKDLPVYKRELDGAFANWRNEVIDKTSQRVKNNVNPSSDPEVIKEVLAYKQAVTNGNQLFDELEKIKTLPVSKYVNKASLLGSAKKTVDERIERAIKGDRSALMEGSIMPDVNDPEHFLYDSYLNDKYGKRDDIVTSEDTVVNGPLGERIIDKKVTAKFVTTKNGKVVPGIDKSVIDDELYSPTTDADTLQARAATFSFADKQILNKALQLKESGDPRYKDMGTNQIVASISSNPADPHYKDFNRNKLAEEVILKKLEPFQKVSTDNNITSGHKYDSNSGSGTEINSPEGIFIKTLAGLQQQTPEFINSLEESEEVNGNGVPYLDATSLFSGINTGQDRKGKASEPDAVFVDPEDQGTIYIRQNPGDPLTPMNNAAVSQFAVQVGNIKGNNLNYKTMLQEGNKLGVFGANNQFKGENAATPDPKFTKQQKTLSKKVANEVVNRKTQLKSALESDKGSWVTDFNRTKVDKVQDDINNNVLNKATLIAKDQTIKDPKVTIERGLLGGVTYVIKGSDNTEIKLTEDEFYSIAEGNSDSGRLIVGREAVKSKPATKAKKSISGF